MTADLIDHTPVGGVKNNHLDPRIGFGFGQGPKESIAVGKTGDIISFGFTAGNIGAAVALNSAGKKN
ncbi:MAG TPA: hypothetical protein VI955_04240, partial [Candidatus Omnitrophota bacterium]|nr:hypothetical protein [Candidatus Omnitrophota bacterium]